MDNKLYMVAGPSVSTPSSKLSKMCTKGKARKGVASFFPPNFGSSVGEHSIKCSIDLVYSTELIILFLAGYKSQLSSNLTNSRCGITLLILRSTN